MNGIGVGRFRISGEGGGHLQHSHLPSAERFYPPNLACTPKNDEVPYMVLYIEGTKIRNKTKCTSNLKMQWEPWAKGGPIPSRDIKLY